MEHMRDAHMNAITYTHARSHLALIVKLIDQQRKRGKRWPSMCRRPLRGRFTLVMVFSDRMLALAA
jgi:hypothetical protein